MLLGAANPRPSLPTALRDDQRIDADEPAAQIDQRAAAAARVDRRVRLDVDHRRSGSSCRATALTTPSDTEFCKPERAAEAPARPARLQLIRVAERQGRQVPFVDLITARSVSTSMPTSWRPRSGCVVAQDRPAGGRHGHLDAQPVGAADDVRVRDDEAVRDDDDAGSRRALGGDQVGGAENRSVARRCTSVGDDLHDGGIHEARRRLSPSSLKSAAACTRLSMCRPG